jgi:hypothetical protein
MDVEDVGGLLPQRRNRDRLTFAPDRRWHVIPGRGLLAREPGIHNPRPSDIDGSVVMDSGPRASARPE